MGCGRTFVEVCHGGDAGCCRVETRPCAPVRSRNAGLNRDGRSLAAFAAVTISSARLPPLVASWPPADVGVYRR